MPKTKSTSEIVAEIMATDQSLAERIAQSFEAMRDGEDLSMDDETDACFWAIEQGLNSKDVPA